MARSRIAVSVCALLLSLVVLVVAQSPPHQIDPQGSSGRPLEKRFNGAFSLINITSICSSDPSGFCAGAWTDNGRGVIGYWAYPGFPGYGNMSASLNHDINNSTGNLTAADKLAAGAFYAGGFYINATGGYVAHLPITSSGAVPTGGKEVRCFQWFEQDEVLRLFVTTSPVDCTGTTVAQLYWRRIVSFSMLGQDSSAAATSAAMITVTLFGLLLPLVL